MHVQRTQLNRRPSIPLNIRNASDMERLCIDVLAAKGLRMKPRTITTASGAAMTTLLVDFGALLKSVCEDVTRAHLQVRAAPPPRDRPVLSQLANCPSSPSPSPPPPPPFASPFASPFAPPFAPPFTPAVHASVHAAVAPPSRCRRVAVVLPPPRPSPPPPLPSPPPARAVAAATIAPSASTIPTAARAVAAGAVDIRWYLSRGRQ